MRHGTDGNTGDHLLGRRVVIRYRLHGQAHAATDVLGVLESATADLLRVRRRPDELGGRGELTEIAVDDVLAVKAIPAQPVTRRAVRDLELAATLGWQGLETERVGGWLLRAAGGFTRRANSCLPAGDPELPVADAVERMVRWYTERELPPVFQIPTLLGAGLSALLDAGGWERGSDVSVLTAPVSSVEGGHRPELPEVRIDDAPDDAWLSRYHYRGAELPPQAVDVIRRAPTVGFASVDLDGSRVAIARGALSTAPSGRPWLGITAVEVAPEARRRGLGSHVVAGLASWASALGHPDAYLQVEEANTGAQRAYRRLGFGDHHAYHYRRQPS